MPRPPGTRPLTIDVLVGEHDWLWDHTQYRQRLSMAEWVRAVIEIAMSDDEFAARIDSHAIATRRPRKGRPRNGL